MATTKSIPIKNITPKTAKPVAKPASKGAAKAAAKKKKAAPKITYDCLKCPGYCCSYPLIEVTKRDMQRLAKHFNLPFYKAKAKFFRYDRSEKSWALRHHKDEHFGTICRFFDREKRQCTVYKARPGVCRDYPLQSSCGYYDFLVFEREHQDDPEFIATTHEYR
ncbi:MAG: YkgJ family cysteine cluster protein [Betaproteobacteria bacterium]|nr:YkgJ family cysteine cluster protein [Betaproteobacteria bacterium]